MSVGNHVELSQIALRAREHVVRMAGKGGCFLGSAFSCIDILVYLYCRVLRGVNTDDPTRDRFLLSKGHAVPALYGVLAELGHLSAVRLAAHLSTTDNIYWHPHRSIPGVEFNSGSLGHGPPIAVGMALDLQLRQSTGSVFCMVGDGELNEGSVWEALLVAAAKRTDRLFLIVDRNCLQANSPTEHILPLEPLVDKFRAFGCSVRSTDGHDFAQLETAFSNLPGEPGRPTVIIARSVRGKGIASMENDIEQWFVELDPTGVETALRELQANTL